MREHRLYQADWLMRHYGFAAEEILEEPGDGMLDLKRDPKLAWALRNRGLFPVDVNRAPRETLLARSGNWRARRRAHSRRTPARHAAPRRSSASRAVARGGPAVRGDAGLAADSADQLRLAAGKRLAKSDPRQLDLFAQVDGTP